MNYDDLDYMQKLAFDYGYQTEMEKIAGPKWDKAKEYGRAAWDHVKKAPSGLAEGLSGLRDIGASPREAASALKDSLKDMGVKKTLRANKNLLAALGVVGAAGAGAGYGGHKAYKKYQKK